MRGEQGEAREAMEGNCKLSETRGLPRPCPSATSRPAGAQGHCKPALLPGLPTSTGPPSLADLLLHPHAPQCRFLSPLSPQALANSAFSEPCSSTTPALWRFQGGQPCRTSSLLSRRMTPQNSSTSTHGSTRPCLQQSGRIWKTCSASTGRTSSCTCRVMPRCT